MTAEKFEDFCVAGKELFLVQNNSHKVYTLLNWEEYGLRITIPHEAVPLYDTVEVAITALVGGEFILPEDTELVSAVYAISVSKQFLKPVQLEIQHCVSIEKPAHSNYLSFATTPSDKASCEFQPVKGAGVFSTGSRYGSISITEFSLWSVIKNKLKRSMRLSNTSIHPSQSSLSPSTEAVHSSIQHQPSPPITVSTTPLPVVSQSSLSPSTEAVHSSIQHQPSPPITVSTTPLPVVSQSSLSPSTEAVHSPTQHQPSPPITVSTTPLPVVSQSSLSPSTEAVHSSIQHQPSPPITVSTTPLPVVSQSSLSPSTEAVHSPIQHQPLPPVTISTTPLPVIPEASPCSSESSPSITVSSTTTLDNTAPTDSSLLEGMYTLQLYTCYY